ncbi:MAG: TlpA family protein disulfide reductase, partial [Xanthomonadales bacterium]|nr:TlpA family protein disulfide reductase [Xanthomonadales bacterium]
MLIFATGLVALLCGALFYAARIPVAVETAPKPASSVPAEASAPRVPDIVTHPEFTLPDISGRERSFSEWQGRNRLLNFWATWCAPCRREIPLLKTFQ